MPSLMTQVFTFVPCSLVQNRHGISMRFFQDRKQRLVVGMALYPYDADHVLSRLSTYIVLNDPRLDLGDLRARFDLPTLDDPIGINV